MELRHLHYFVGVAEALSFTKAAEKLRVAQPSLTRQIKDLEDELGVQLLNRTKQQVDLTEEGRAFFGDAKRLLALADEMVDSVRRLSRGQAGSLNVGYVADIFYDLLPKTLTSLRESLPHVAINLFDMSCGEQFSALENGIIDLAFVGLHEPIEKRGFHFRRIASYETVVALPAADDLTRKPVVDLKDLAPKFFIGMSEASYPGYRTWLNRVCFQAGFAPKVLQDVSLERSMIQAVGAGLGVALVPEQIKRLSQENVAFRALRPSVGTEGCVAWKAGNRSAALETYVRIVIERAGQAEAPLRKQANG